MRLLSIFSICVFLIACSTPTELLQKGKTDLAFKKASKKLKRGKDIVTNTEVIIQAGDQIAKNTISYNLGLIQSDKVKSWTLAQRNYDKSLRELFAANDLVNGKLQSSYDKLCTEKIELDFKIADHFYQLGEDLLATHYEQLSKHHAREAYFEYQECLSFGGDRFFQDIPEKMNECVEEGLIYFVSYDFTPSSNLFFRRLPIEEDREPDCVISADFGYPHFSETESSCTSSFTEKIEVGKKSETDTSGVVHYYPIYEEVTGSVTTTTVTISASSTSYVNVDNVTGYCFKSGSCFSNSVSDSYEIVEFSGDHRAIPSHYSEGTTGNPFFIRSNLEQELSSEIDFDLFTW